MINLNLFSIMHAWQQLAQQELLQQKKIYQELGVESRKSRRWFRKLCHFYKIFSEKSPSYLFNLAPNFNRVHNTRLSYDIPPIKVRHDYFKNSFFSFVITELNKLDHSIRYSASLNTFKKMLLNFIRPYANSIFDIHNPLGIKFLTRLRLGLSHFHEHKFMHCFQNTLNPLCECGTVLWYCGIDTVSDDSVIYIGFNLF